MDVCLSETSLVQQEGVQSRRNLRQAANPWRCGYSFSTTPYTRFVILLIVSYHLHNAGAIEGDTQDNAKLSPSSTTLPVLVRRGAIKRGAAGSHVNVDFPGTCPVCNCPVCSQPADPSHQNAPVKTPVHAYRPDADAIPQASLFSLVPSPTTDIQATTEPRRPKLANSSWEAFHGAPPQTEFLSAPPGEALLPALTGWSDDERKGKVNSFSGEEEDDDDDREEGVYAEPEWFFLKRAGGGGGMRNLEKNFKQWMRKRLGRKYDPNTCKKLKRDGRQPSAALRHSPIHLFGYPVFDERSGRTILERRLPLSVVQGYLVPIRVGAEDYVVQGTFDEISSFLECFEEYQTIGSKLQPDGHWSADAEHGPLFLQVQNTLEDMESPFDTSKLLYRWGFDRLVRVVAGAQSIKTLAETTSYDKIMEIIDSVENISDFLPHVTTEELFEFWEQLGHQPSIPDRVILLCAFLKKSFSRSPAEKNPRWIDDDALRLRKPLTVTITSYPKPSHGLRATYRMESNVVTLRDIKNALSSLFLNSTMAYALREVSEADGGQRKTKER